MPLALLSIFVLLMCALLIGFVAATAAGKLQSVRVSAQLIVILSHSAQAFHLQLLYTIQQLVSVT